MATLRTKDTYLKNLQNFKTHIYVVCPNCGKQAIFTSPPEQRSDKYETAKVTCHHCGFNQVSRGNVSSYFGLTLWLQIDCEGEQLWAYNYEHLDWLKKHVEALLRERNGIPIYNSSIGSRLPRWMTSKKNRSKVLKCIEKLRQR